MTKSATTIAIQRYLSELRSTPIGEPAEPIVRDLISRSAHRLRILAAAMLNSRFPRLARPPAGVEADDLLAALVERLLKALREARPNDVRHFYALANQHLRWELMDLARRLDEHAPPVPLGDAVVPAHESTGGGLTSDARRILAAIGRLPDEEREAFDLVRIQELTLAEAAEIVGVATKTVHRRLMRAIDSLTDELGDLAPSS